MRVSNLWGWEKERKKEIMYKLNEIQTIVETSYWVKRHGRVVHSGLDAASIVVFVFSSESKAFILKIGCRPIQVAPNSTKE